MRNILVLAIILSFWSCNCIEPDSDYIKNDFVKYYSDFELISVENTENSPPCSYWKINYKSKNKNDSIIQNEIWQYWETDQKCYWRLRIIKKDTTYYIEKK